MEYRLFLLEMEEIDVYQEVGNMDQLNANK